MLPVMNGLLREPLCGGFSPSPGTPGEGWGGEGWGGGCVEDARAARTPSPTLPRSTGGGDKTRPHLIFLIAVFATLLMPKLTTGAPPATRPSAPWPKLTA